MRQFNYTFKKVARSRIDDVAAQRLRRTDGEIQVLCPVMHVPAHTGLLVSCPSFNERQPREAQPTVFPALSCGVELRRPLLLRD